MLDHLTTAQKFMGGLFVLCVLAALYFVVAAFTGLPPYKKQFVETRTKAKTETKTDVKSKNEVTGGGGGDGPVVAAANSRSNCVNGAGHGPPCSRSKPVDPPGTHSNGEEHHKKFREQKDATDMAMTAMKRGDIQRKKTDYSLNYHPLDKAFGRGDDATTKVRAMSVGPAVPKSSYDDDHS